MKQAMKTYLKVTINLITMLVTVLLCIFLLPKIIVFFMPFIIGWIIAWIASPLVRFLEEKLKIRRKAVSAFVIIAVLAGVVLLVYGIGAKLVRETISFINELPVLWQNIEREFNQIGANLEVVFRRLPQNVQEQLWNFGNGLGNYLSDVIGSINLGSSTVNVVGSIAKQLPDIFIAVIMSLLSAYFFVADKAYLSDFAKKHVPEAIYYRFDMIRRSFRKAVGGYFKAQFKIEVWIYLEVFVGLLILGIDYAFLIAFGIALLDLLPVFGTGTVMIPWAIIEILSGEYKRAIGLLIIWCVGQLLRQIIQPKIVGDSIGLDAIPTIFLLYIGYHVAGVAGMIFAVPIGIIVLNLYEEGVFDTTKKSMKILFAGFNKFRRIRDEDMAVVFSYEEEIKESYQEEILEQKKEEKKEK